MAFSLDNVGLLVSNKRPKYGTKNRSRKMENIELLAQIDHVQRLLGSIRVECEEAVRADAIQAFLADGLEAQRHPGNYIAEDNGSTASIELRKYGCALNDDAIALAEAHGLPVEVATEVHATYAIAPEYATDEVIMRKVEKALIAAKLPDDILKRQPGVTTTRTTTTTIDEIMKLPRKVAEVILSTFSTLTVARLKFPGTDQQALDAVAALGVELDIAA